MKFIGYLRTSTDDKGQDPLRQLDVLNPWVKAGGHEMPAYVVDEGTSGAKDPFQRQFFREAIDLAEKHKADGILVEAIDRATRGGVEAFMVLKSNLRLEYDLTIKTATTPPGLPPAVEELYESTMAMVARMWRDRHVEAVKSGIARAKANGFPNGAPGRLPKPALTLAEKDLVRELVLVKGAGVDKVALEVSRLRGAFEIGDPGARDRRKVGPTWVWKQARSQIPEVRERWAAKSANGLSGKEVKQKGPRWVKCPSCPATIGEVCKNPKGGRAGYHSARKRLGNDTCGICAVCQEPVRNGISVLIDPLRHPLCKPKATTVAILAEAGKVPE